MKRVLGRHIIADFHGCDPRLLKDVEHVKQVMLNAARTAKATILDVSMRFFDPGVTGVVVLAESHLTVHTWPEYRYAAVDLFTCGPAGGLQPAINSMQELFAAERVSSTMMDRGIVEADQRAETLVHLDKSPLTRGLAA